MRTVRALVLRAALLALLWWVLVEGRGEYAAYGLLAVPPAVAVSLWLSPPRDLPARAGPSGASRLPALARLVGWYAAQTVLGAVDVARRLLRRRADVSPVVVHVATRLPEGPLRQTAVAMYGLMPGSLVSAADGEELSLHSLAAELDAAGQWRALEERLAAAAGVELGPERL